MITYEELHKMSNSELDRYYADLFSKIKRDDLGYTNVQRIVKNSKLENWEKLGQVMYLNTYSCFYRLAPEPEMVAMSDEECRVFVRDNIDKILIRRKATNILEKHASFYLDTALIARDCVFCLLEDFNCKEPSKTVWKEFKKPVME